MTEGFTKDEFMKELDKYDVVRPRDWQGWRNVQSTPSEVQSQIQSLPRPPSLEPTLGFWGSLRAFLNTYYESDDTEKIINEFRKENKKYINSLSLDDIERLVAALPK